MDTCVDAEFIHVRTIKENKVMNLRQIERWQVGSGYNGRHWMKGRERRNDAIMVSKIRSSP